MKYLAKIYGFIFLSIIVTIGYLYISLDRTQTQFLYKLDQIFIKQAKSFAQNIDNEIQKDLHNNFMKKLQNNEEKQHELNDFLSAVVTQTYKYVYVLYRDKSGRYRYLLDGSPVDERGELGEPFVPDNIAIWNNVYDTQHGKIIRQKDIHAVWITYLKPIVVKGKTEAIIVMDFSTNVPQNIAYALQPLQRGFYYIFGALFILLLILFYQTYMNFKVKKDAITDALTGAFNRNYLRTFLQNVNIAKYQILMFDIDHFKQVNDTYGHDIGDNILRDVSEMIKSMIRPDDIFVRFGGEEFLLFVLKERYEERDPAKIIAERIRNSIALKEFVYGDISLHITLSVGVTLKPESFKSISDAIKHADEMLYIAKKEGRNQVVSTSMGVQNKENPLMHINDIKEALENGRIFCVYQPIFDTKTKQIVKYEALVRLRDKEGKIIAPYLFLPVIMHTSIYNDMTKKVLEIVFATIRKKDVTVSVNLNFSDVVDKEMFSTLISEIENNKVIAKHLVVELLEYEVLENEERFVRNLRKIQSYGVKIAIDDFGAGFANYNVFQDLPIDVIKIDASLIKNIDRSKVSESIVKSIVLLTNELGLTTVAEFVHSATVYDVVKYLGVEYIQGFYLGEPQEEI